MYEYNLGLRFQRVADERGQQIAVWFNKNETLNYEELNKLANRMARWLMTRGVAPDNVVCISGEKSFHTFACMIACLKIGAIYCVLDPDSPPERLRRIISSCTPKLLLAKRKLLDELASITFGLEIVAADQDPAKLERMLTRHFDDANLPETHGITGANPAYLMFTSGSTGFPKGVVITHANVLNLVDWSNHAFGITRDDILTNVNPLYFDNSVFDFYAALFNGARLVPFTKEEVKDPKLLVDKIEDSGCTLWFSVPSLLIFLQTMRAADGQNLRSIRRFVFGGEAYPKPKLKLLYDAYSQSAEFYNVYGPTECACICSCYRITDEDFADLQGLPPLGQIADNFTFLILDEAGTHVSPGETGELCLLGPNVGKGYYNDAERSAVSFVQNPYNEKFAEVMYKTGDLVRLDPRDGTLYIQGRQDNQIKHMGYRIELEEIECALNCLDYVSEAAALQVSGNGLSRIIAVVSANEALDSDRIRADLKQIIPDYMIPSVFHRAETLPKDPNGKIDRGSLAERYLSQ